MVSQSLCDQERGSMGRHLPIPSADSELLTKDSQEGDEAGCCVTRRPTSDPNPRWNSPCMELRVHLWCQYKEEKVHFYGKQFPT